MDSKMFNAILPIIIGDLASKIMLETGDCDDDALDKLYNSKLYSLLEIEETKVWQYSTPMLYRLYANEIATGELVFMD